MNPESKILLDIHKEEFENYKKYIDSNNWFDDVFFNTKKGNILAQVTSYVEDSNGSPSIKLDFLMSRRKDFNAKAKATHFVKEAALTTQKKMEDFYAKNAQFQFDKVLKSTI